MEASPRAYARAVYETAVSDWLDDLRTIKQRVERRKLVTELDDPSKTIEEKKALLGDVLEEDLDHRARNFVYTLASNNDVSMLDDIIADYERLLRQGAVELPLAQVTSAVSLTDEEREAIEARLSRQFGEELEVNYSVDPSILGGVIVRVGDKYIDGSVATRLEKMRERLAKRQ